MQQQPTVNTEVSTEVVTSTSRRPSIGIVGHMLPNGNSVGVTFPYLSFFERFGDVKIIIPTSKGIDTSLDLLVIPGGPDILASRYLDAGDAPSWYNQKPDQMREYFDMHMLPKYIENKIPLFGICRGHQSIAALFGAKLEQQLFNHEMNDENKRHEVSHHVVGYVTDLNSETKCLELDKKFMASNFGVNSMHHQAVTNIPKDANILLWTDEKMPKKQIVYSFDSKNPNHKIEGLIYKDYPIVTVQYHPEEMNNVYDVDIINDLIKCSRNF